MNHPGAVATPHRTATGAAESVLADGGNAVDAALAAAAVLTVVYPHQCAIGGDAFALVGGPDHEPVVVNGSGRSARGWRRADHLDAGGHVPVTGARSVTVPGVLDLWHQLADRWGSRPLGAALLGAAGIAAEGFAVAPGLRRGLEQEADALAADPGARELFLPGGELLRAGQHVTLPRLADSLRTLAAEGTGAFYTGALGASVVATLRAGGSALDAEDFATHTSSLSAPLGARFAGEEYLSSGGNSQGRFFLRGLAALEVIRQRRARVPDALGAEAAPVGRVLALCAAERDRLLGDPGFSPDPGDVGEVSDLVEAALGSTPIHRVLSAQADGRPPHLPARASGDTVAIVTTDGEGRWVSLIQSVFHTFGSGVVDPETGILLHNRGACFSGVAGSPNEIGPGRRPAHTLMPVLVRRDGRLVGAHGTRGGRAQPQIHTHLALNLAAGLTAGEAVARPRWIVGRLTAGARPEEDGLGIAVEQGVGETAADGLRAAGFRTTALAALDDAAGHLQVVRETPDGPRAASDPRADG
ncbi:gamma-glutamyltransferase [Streptomyces sp. CBMA156]|uniref:gamma-glutamyltransferase n=1 Tax=Streptomyces sp. CBMA156 TaxID=1930280 RepID=UPI001661AE12|nr:gamma-glutamyltransferase [Streptomyces sp. CBMA156]MBD0671100.1 hypothetical protein [Streptomyces sp. CBMA156]MBD0671740.1 hypothetical protein [Streptomyces sp. CBMA156]